MKEKASIASKEDFDNVLAYLRDEAKEVDIEEPWIYTEQYEIKVESGWEKIYDEIEAIFSVNETDEVDVFAKLNLPPKEVKNIHDMNWNTY